MLDANKVARPYPAPMSTVQGGPTIEISCDSAIIVYNQDVHFPLTVKLGTFILAQNLKAPGYSGLFCTTAPGFPNPPASSKLIIEIAGSNTVLYNGPPPPGMVTSKKATQITIYHPYNPVGPSTPSPNPFYAEATQRVADPPAKPPVPPQVGTKAVPYMFQLSPASLFSGQMGAVKWPMTCSPFAANAAGGVNCVLQTINSGKYPGIGSTLNVDAYWTIFDTNGAALKTDTLKYPSGGTVGQFSYYGFVSASPANIVSHQWVQFQGHFDYVGHQPSDYQCDFSCHMGGVNWARHTSANSLSANFMACPAPDFTGIKHGMSCVITVTFKVSANPVKEIQLPFTHANAFTYQDSAFASPIGAVKTLTETYIKPTDKISITTSSSCDALMIHNDYDTATHLTVVFNNTDWVDDLAPGQVSQLKCLNYLPTNGKEDEEVPVLIYPKGLPTQPIWNEKSKASWWVGSGTKGAGSWTSMKVSKYKGKATLIPETIPVAGLKCALTAGSNTEPWPITCPPPSDPTTPYTLGQPVTCTIPARTDGGSYPPVNSDGTGATFIHTHCSVLFPGPGPSSEWPIVNMQALKFYQDELPYTGFIEAPSTPEGLKIGEQWFANGVFDTDIDNFEYSCQFSHTGMVPISTKATKVTTLQIFCPTPGVSAYPQYPITVSAAILQRNVKSGVTAAIPQTGKLEIVFVNHGGTNSANYISGSSNIHVSGSANIHVSGSANIHVSGKSQGHGGRTAGIVIGVLLGIVVIVGGVGAYFYFVRTKKHQGFVAIQ
eukprot:TRINITY_DN44250_c0_g1_i1.p1 TRINITY_DN44250_c0_g1~~TRINITY_DN44250_c0_g1_i1.p1  ORF type:complete len:826 (-),score=117.22 TRINITY_DN44250_c0_g1_i1:1934-4252(-)